MVQRKKYSVYGSCQAPALAQVMNSCPRFASEWEFIEIPPCYAVSEEQIDHFAKELLPDLDLLLYQPVSEDYRGPQFSSEFLRNCQPAGAMALSVQYMHWEAYHPTLNQVYGLPPHPEGYVDTLVAAAIGMGVDRATYLRRLEEVGASLAIDMGEIEAWCVSELKARESGENDGGKRIDITVTDFISTNYRNSRLFYTVNHPTVALLHEASAQCMLKLGYAHSDIWFDPVLDPLNASQIALYPIYRDVFSFNEDKRMSDSKLLSNTKSYEVYLGEQFDWFERLPSDDVGDFFERLATSRPWLRTSLRRAFAC
ncbi:WcbI family polysaccharide biosynthesis putative acetyltransferase [Cupriavidus necator]